jgi:hypothetical protein
MLSPALVAWLFCGPSAGASLAAFSARTSPEAACAALDHHLLWHVEEAGALGAVEPEQLLAVIEDMMAARRVCRNGSVAEAIRIYEELDLGPSRVRWLR